MNFSLYFLSYKYPFFFVEFKNAELRQKILKSERESAEMNILYSRLDELKEIVEKKDAELKRHRMEYKKRKDLLISEFQRIEPDYKSEEAKYTYLKNYLDGLRNKTSSEVSLIYCSVFIQYLQVVVLMMIIDYDYNNTYSDFLLIYSYDDYTTILTFMIIL